MADDRLFDEDLTPAELRALVSRARPVTIVHTRDEYVRASGQHRGAAPLRVVRPSGNRGVPGRRLAPNPAEPTDSLGDAAAEA